MSAGVSPRCGENWIVARGDAEEYAGRPVRPEDDEIERTSPRGGLRNLDAVFPDARASHAAAGTATR
ncbi:hypothetical protein STENM327S_03278 [Streptomyces tendae]